MQSMQLVAPAREVYLAIGHEMQSAPAIALYLPTEQSAQTVAPAAENFP